ncbi:FecR family protein [Desulfonema magnum]|nr:FecR family protein [Desulfonema magnum]
MKSVCTLWVMLMFAAAGENVMAYAASGGPAGYVEWVRGEVLIENPNLAPRYAKKGEPLYKGDKIRTSGRGKVQFTLKGDIIRTRNGDKAWRGESRLILAPETELMIIRHVYHSKEKTRSSFIDMGLGTVRFLVKKLMDWDSKFKVRTNMVMAGVEGSDFILRSTNEFTEVTTFGDTTLKVVRLSAPDQPFLIKHSQGMKISEHGCLSVKNTADTKTGDLSFYPVNVLSDHGATIVSADDMVSVPLPPAASSLTVKKARVSPVLPPAPIGTATEPEMEDEILSSHHTFIMDKITRDEDDVRTEQEDKMPRPPIPPQKATICK